ncbi:MAG TPA: L-lactate permease [Terriglobales bacterium]
MHLWSQPIAPLHSIVLSAVAAALPLAVVLVVMGVLRKPGYIAAWWGLLCSLLLAFFIWHMPAGLAMLSMGYGFVYALWPIMWIVFAALWLYNLTVETGKFDLLRCWMERHASGDMRVQAIMVAFCFGALLEGTAGFGAPVAVTAFLLLALGFKANRAVTVSLIANTTPVAFGALGIPIVALAAVTGLDQMKLSQMVGRQLPFMSLLVPAYLVAFLSGRKGLKQTWPAALVAGATFAGVQFAVANYWGPYAVDVLASLASIVVLTVFLRFWKPKEVVRSTAGAPDLASVRQLSIGDSVAAWAPWVLLAVVMVIWSYFKIFQKLQMVVPVPWLHNAVYISLYGKPYAALYNFQPLAAGTAALTATLIAALALRAPARTFLRSGLTTFRQLLLPGLTVVLIVGLSYVYNYSGMAYTLGAALASLGEWFPLASGFLGWTACFLSGSDTSSNLLFGNLQVAAGHQLGISPVLLAATNSSGAVTGKMISPQNIAVGVTTVGLAGKEGGILREIFWHSLLFAAILSLLAFAQAYVLRWMVP